MPESASPLHSRFQSTPPCRRRLVRTDNLTPIFRFQSTPPCRRRLFLLTQYHV